MPIRNNPLPTDPSTGSLPPAYEAVDLGNPHLAHGGAPAESPEHRGVGGRLLGWLGGTDDDAGAYRSYSYFPHHGSLEGGLPAHHAGAAGAPTAGASDPVTRAPAIARRARELS